MEQNFHYNRATLEQNWNDIGTTLEQHNENANAAKNAMTTRNTIDIQTSIVAKNALATAPMVTTIVMSVTNSRYKLKKLQ